MPCPWRVDVGHTLSPERSRRSHVTGEFCATLSMTRGGNRRASLGATGHSPSITARQAVIRLFAAAYISRRAAGPGCCRCHKQRPRNFIRDTHQHSRIRSKTGAVIRTARDTQPLHQNCVVALRRETNCPPTTPATHDRVGREVLENTRLSGPHAGAGSRWDAGSVQPGQAVRAQPPELTRAIGASRPYSLAGPAL